MRTYCYLAGMTFFILYPITGNLLREAKETFRIEVHIVLSFPDDRFKIFPYINGNGNEVVLETRQ
jgi:hypothetical protein